MVRCKDRLTAALRLAASGLLPLLLAALPVPATALPDDREQPIHITADKAVRDEKRGVTIYSGNVEMRQGSMELDADSLTIYHESQDADKIIARGAPAKMRQRPDLDKGLVHAHADVITYFRRKELIHLRTAARIEREDGTLVTGDSIDYYIVDELVKAESDRNDEDNKVFVVIPPSLIEDEPEIPGETDADNDSVAEGEAPAAGQAAPVGNDEATQGAVQSAPAPVTAGGEDGAANSGDQAEAVSGGRTQSE